MMRNRKAIFNLANAPEAVRRAAPDRLPIRVQNNAGDPTIFIYETIGEDALGEGLHERDVVNFLNQNQGLPITVRINSPGGSVYSGLTIFNSLLSHPQPVTAMVEGLAYSAASFIAMAADTVKMFPQSNLGIHRAGVMTIGNQKDHQAAIEWLQQVDSHLIDIYADRTKRSKKQIEQWLDGVSDGTIFSAREAVRYGFADEVVDTKRSTANASHRTGAVGTKRSVAAARARLKLKSVR